MVSCTLRPEKKSPKIADFGDFDFQNPKNQQNLKYKMQPSTQKSWKGDKKHVFSKKLCFLCFFLVLSPAPLRKYLIPKM